MDGWGGGGEGKDGKKGWKTKTKGAEREENLENPWEYIGKGKKEGGWEEGYGKGGIRGIRGAERA
jgi:hypothetical protein